MTDHIKRSALNRTPGNDFWKEGVYTPKSLIEYFKCADHKLNVEFSTNKDRFKATYSHQCGRADLVIFTAYGDTMLDAVNNLVGDMRRAYQCLAGEITLLPETQETKGSN